MVKTPPQKLSSRFLRHVPSGRRTFDTARQAPKYTARMMQADSQSTTSRFFVRRVDPREPQAAVALSSLQTTEPPTYHIPSHTNEEFPRAVDTPVAARVGEVCETGITGKPFSFAHFLRFFRELYGDKVEPVWLRFTVKTKKQPGGRHFRAAVSFGRIKGTRMLRVIELIYQEGRAMCQLRAVYPSQLIGDVEVLYSNTKTQLPFSY